MESSNPHSIPQPTSHGQPWPLPSPNDPRNSDPRAPETQQSLPPRGNPSGFTPGPAAATQFEIFEWYPSYLSCQKYFLDHSQYEESVRAVCALSNIHLPHQWHSNPIHSSTPSSQRQQPYRNSFEPQSSHPNQSKAALQTNVSLVPYIRRLVVTGFDRDPVLHGFFGDDWRTGIGPIQECERRNYLFAAKSGGWAQMKSQYDMDPQQTVPFLQPPQSIGETELGNAEKLWSQWLAMEDWMVGPRAPESMEDYERSGDGRSPRSTQGR